MKTFADIRRTIKPGMRLRVVHHDYRPELTGTERLVTDVQGNGYYFTSTGDPRRVWSSYAKASCYSFPTPTSYRQDQGSPCSCCSRVEGPHSPGCNVSTGRRMAWTIEVLS